MKKQPFLLVFLEDGKKKLINESQVVSVGEGKNKLVHLRMSNGDEIIIKKPAYEDWENDYHTRKD